MSRVVKGMLRDPLRRRNRRETVARLRSFANSKNFSARFGLRMYRKLYRTNRELYVGVKVAFTRARNHHYSIMRFFSITFVVVHFLFLALAKRAPRESREQYYFIEFFLLLHALVRKRIFADARKVAILILYRTWTSSKWLLFATIIATFMSNYMRKMIQSRLLKKDEEIISRKECISLHAFNISCSTTHRNILRTLYRSLLYE